jgi:hypothetical protein
LLYFFILKYESQKISLFGTGLIALYNKKQKRNRVSKIKESKAPFNLEELFSLNPGM